MTDDRIATDPDTAHISGGDDPTRRRIIEAARVNLRRFGASKATVVDIARDLGMSHSNVYRFFRTKAEILDAVVEEWLREEEVLLAALSEDTGAAGDRLEQLVVTLVARKRAKRTEDAELSALYYRIVAERPAALTRYDETISAAIARLIADGVRNGEFAIRDIPAAVRVVRHALQSFFAPSFGQDGADADASVRDVVRTLVAGFANRAQPPAFATAVGR